jgi:hypothetical protein
MTMKLFKPPTPPNTISDEQMAGLRQRALKANPEKARFDTSKEAAEKRKAQNLQHERRTQS